MDKPSDRSQVIDSDWDRLPEDMLKLIKHYEKSSVLVTPEIILSMNENERAEVYQQIKPGIENAISEFSMIPQDIDYQKNVMQFMAKHANSGLLPFLWDNKNRDIGDSFFRDAKDREEIQKITTAMQGALRQYFENRDPDQDEYFKDIEQHLQFANLKDFPGTNFSNKANLTAAHLENALNQENLSGIDLKSAIIHKSNLGGKNLSDTNMARAKLFEVSLTDSNLSGVNLAGAYFSNTNLNGANLTGADFTDVKIRYKSDLSAEQITSTKSFRGVQAHMDMGSRDLEQCKKVIVNQYRDLIEQSTDVNTSFRLFWDAYDDPSLNRKQNPLTDHMQSRTQGHTKSCQEVMKLAAKKLEGHLDLLTDPLNEDQKQRIMKVQNLVEISLIDRLSGDYPDLQKAIEKNALLASQPKVNPEQTTRRPRERMPLPNETTKSSEHSHKLEENPKEEQKEEPRPGRTMS